MTTTCLPFTPQLEAQLRAWLAEDLGRGDLTAAALAGCSGRAHWRAKADGVFCGGVLVERLFQLLDPGVVVRLLVRDGVAVAAGQRLLELLKDWIGLLSDNSGGPGHFSAVNTGTSALLRFVKAPTKKQEGPP